MPFIDIAAQERVRSFGRTEFDDPEQEADFYAHKDEMPVGHTLQTPTRGGYLWYGEDEASEMTNSMIDVADKNGDLRGILEAVRSNRIVDDFTDRWSFEREDFERKLYSKRNKVKVTFIELDDAIPVHGADSEVHDHLLWENFFALLDAKERRVVVCLMKGETQIGDIAANLGYRNHSPVSKQLVRIREKVKSLLR